MRTHTACKGCGQ